MIRITLFQDCILNETYQNVFSLGKETGQTKNVLERYLETLNSITFTGDYVYYENSGELVIDYQLGTKNIYDYNYMKVEEYNDEINALILTRYCFIQSISLKNDCAYISYIEDVWSSYSDKIKGITKSYWSNARILNYPNKNIGLRNLPVNYDGNEEIIINKDTINFFNIVVKVQYYNTSTYGDSTDRDYDIFVLNLIERSWRIDSGGTKRELYNVSDTINFTLSKLYSVVDKVVKYQSKQAMHYNENSFSDAVYFEIEDFTIVPKDFINQLWLEDISYTPISTPTRSGYYISSYFIADNIVDIESPTPSSEDYFVLRRIKASFKDVLISNYSKTFSNNFKRLSLGTFNTQIDCINNGNDIETSVNFYFSKGQIYIILNIENKLVDITNDFTYVVPFTSLLGEENSMRKLTRALNNVSLGINTGKEILNTAISYTGVGRNLNFFEDRIKSLMFTKTGRLTTSKAKLEKIASLRQREENYQQNAIENIGNFGELPIGDIIKNNAPLYSSTKGTFIKSDGILNAKYGLFELEINPSNEDYVKETINNEGYQIYELITDYNLLALNNPAFFINYSINYNIVRFDYVNVYGSFSRDIALILNSILETGVKVWFDYQMIEDNYNVI